MGAIKAVKTYFASFTINSILFEKKKKKTIVLISLVFGLCIYTFYNLVYNQYLYSFTG